MKSQEVTVNGRKVIDVTMTNDTELLDEVVVVGYGTSKKSSLTSAVSAVKGDELLKAPASIGRGLWGGGNSLSTYRPSAGEALRRGG